VTWADERVRQVSLQTSSEVRVRRWPGIFLPRSCASLRAKKLAAPLMKRDVVPCSCSLALVDGAKLCERPQSYTTKRFSFILKRNSKPASRQVPALLHFEAAVLRTVSDFF
jgi:hypothetical protein